MCINDVSLVFNVRADVLLPGPLQCPQVYSKMLVDIVRTTFDTEPVNCLLSMLRGLLLSPALQTHFFPMCFDDV